MNAILEEPAWYTCGTDLLNPPRPDLDLPPPETPLRPCRSAEGRRRLARLPADVAGFVETCEPFLLRWGFVGRLTGRSPAGHVMFQGIGLVYARELDELGSPVWTWFRLELDMKLIAHVADLLHWMQCHHRDEPYSPLPPPQMSDLVEFFV